MPQPKLGMFGQAMYDSLAQFQYAEPETNWALAIYLDSIGQMLDNVELIVRDTEDGPGWSILMDVDRCPTFALPWLGQFVGVRIVGQQPGESDAAYDARARQTIKETGGWRRGTPASMIGAAKPFLSSPQTVIMQERYGSAYHLVYSVYSDQLLAPAAVVEAAVRKQKPAGIQMEFLVITAHTYQAVYAGFATYALVRTTYASYDHMLTDTRP